jgi:predicted PurR-regulated permease PerM
MGRLALTLRKWFRAQLTDMAIIGGLTMFGLWLVGAKYWAVFGLLTAILGLIPYLGILIMVVVAGLVTFASDPLMVPWVLGVFVITQQIEGNIVLPLVMKDQIDIPEMPLLIFMLLMATWFGLIGVFLSTPVFALFKVLHAELIRPKLESS